MQNYDFLLKLQILLQLLTGVFCIFLFRLFQLIENEKREIKIVKFVANHSWEYYLIQTLIIPLCCNIIFPINIIVVVFSTTILSVILKEVCKYIIEVKDKNIFYIKDRF